MQNTLSAVAAVLAMALIGPVLASFYVLDRLICYEYQVYREAWERDDRPNGFFFRPAEIARWRCDIAPVIST
jgi:hypothetical protein